MLTRNNRLLAKRIASLRLAAPLVSSAAKPMLPNNNNNINFSVNHKQQFLAAQQQRFYSAKSHFHGVLYSMYFVFEAFKKAIDEMQQTEANAALSLAERAKQLTEQFNMFQSGLKVWTHMERQGYITALHHKVQKRETADVGNANLDKDVSHRMNLETVKQHHAKESLQMEKCSRALFELKKHAHDNSAKATEFLGIWSDELRALRQMLTDHVQWEELQLLPMITKHFSMREMAKVHLEAMQQLRQGSTNSTGTVVEDAKVAESVAPLESWGEVMVKFPFSKNNFQLCETMVREVLRVCESDAELGTQLLAEMKKHIDPKMWAELKVRIPELASNVNEKQDKM